METLNNLVLSSLLSPSCAYCKIIMFDTGGVIILDYKVILVDSSHPVSLARGSLKKCFFKKIKG